MVRTATQIAGRRHQLRENCGRKPKFSENDRRTIVSKFKRITSIRKRIKIASSVLFSARPPIRLSEFFVCTHEQIKNCCTDFIKNYLIYKHIIESAGMPELFCVAIGPLRILRKAYTFGNLTQVIYWIERSINFLN